MPVSFDLFVVSEREDGLLEGSLLHLPWLGLGGDIHLWLLEPTRPPHLWQSVDYEIRERKWTPPEESVVLRISQPALERLRAWRRERAEEVIARARDEEVPGLRTPVNFDRRHRKKQAKCPATMAVLPGLLT